MFNRKIFQLDQDLGPDDLNGLQGYAQDAFDRLGADVVSANKRYAGLLVAKSGPTSVGIARGTLYASGKMYDAPDARTQDFLTVLPVAGKKIVTVVAYGTEGDTDTVAREFLIDEENGQSQARPVATRRTRICNVQFAYGVEAPTPSAPLLDPGYVAVADILLGTTGVESVEMRAATRVGNLDDHEGRLGDLEEFEAAVGPKVATLTTDLASLHRQLVGQASGDLLTQMLVRIAVAEAKIGIPSTAVSSHANYFLDTRGSNLAHPNSACKVEEGIRFPDAAADEAQLALFNPIDVNAKVVNGLLLPAYTRELWLRTGEAADEMRLSSFSYQSNSLVQKTMSRQVVRYGTPFTVCTNAAYWQAGSYDPLARTFTRGGETFSVDTTAVGVVVGGDPFVHNILRLQQYWTDTVSETYWDAVPVDHVVNGTLVAETFLQGQDMWLDAVGLMFTKLAADGDVTLAVCEVPSYGLPDVERIISFTTLGRADMKLAPAKTVVPIEPVFLKGGRRYAVVVITGADHWVATVPGESFTQGTLFQIIDGAYAQGDGTRDLWLELYRAKPKSARTSLQLQPLSLNGGILAIAINADAVEPAGTQISYEIQVAGVWHPLAEISAYMLGQGGAIPALLPFRITFVGTGDISPGVRLPGSVVRVSRPATAGVHVSDVKTLPGGGSATIRVIERYENWDAAHHQAAVKLLTGVGYATVNNPASTSSVTGIDPKAGPYLERTYVFNLGAAVTAFAIRTEITTDTARITHHVASQKDYAL